MRELSTTRLEQSGRHLSGHFAVQLAALGVDEDALDGVDVAVQLVPHLRQAGLTFIKAAQVQSTSISTREKPSKNPVKPSKTQKNPVKLSKALTNHYTNQVKTR